MARVLVTGASGFVGTHVVQALRGRGDDVTCLVRKTSHREFLEPLGPRFVFGDVTDRESLRSAVGGHDVVLHVAGCVTSLTAKTMFEVNAGGVAHVARACAEQQSPPVLVVVSSLAAAGAATDGHLKLETDPTEPVSIYGRSKLLGERLARRYAREVPITIVRPAIVFGEYDREMLKLFRQIAKTRVHVSPGWRPRRFSILHAADLAELLLRAAERGERLEDAGGKGIYFAGSGENPTFQEIGRLIGDAIGCRRLVQIPCGPRIMWGVAYGAETLARWTSSSPMITLDKIREATAAPWCCSIEKARQQLAYAPAAPLPDRFRQTAEWFKKQGWL